MKPPVRAITAAGLLFLAACAVTPPPRPAGPPDPDAVRSQLMHEEAGTRTARGLARVAFEGPQGSGSASHVVVVALPDRARVEALTPLGTVALVATLRENELRAHSALRSEYWTGRATREALGRLLAVPVPPDLLLRLLAGLPPLPVRSEDPATPDGARVRVDSKNDELWQRVWSADDGLDAAQGAVGRGPDMLFTFAFGDRRPTDGRRFPFEIRVAVTASQSRLEVHYEQLRLNLPVEAELFELRPPTDPRTRIIDLERDSSGRRAP